MNNPVPSIVVGLLVFLTGVVLGTPAEAVTEFEIRGRLHLDAIAFDKDNVDQFSEGFNNRRARLGVDGIITDGWDGRIEVDFAEGGDINPTTFRLRRSLDHGGWFSLGQLKVPQGLNQLTSSNNISFIERSSVSNIVPDSFRMGLAYERFTEIGGLKAMLFGRRLGDFNEDTEGETKDMPLGGAIRGVYSPRLGPGRLHLGTSGVYEDLRENTPISFSDRPEARDSNRGAIRLLNTASSDTMPDAEATFKWGLEAAYISGPFSVEAEYLQVTVNRDDHSDPRFDGWHVQTSYVLTGESRGYANGVFGGVSPDGPWGASEVAVRFSRMDLNDSDIRGGEQSNLTLGINHYVTSHLRFMGNIIFVDVDDSDAVRELTGGEDDDDSPTIFTVRAQYHF